MSKVLSHVKDLDEAKKKIKVYKCCDCKNKYQSLNVLYKHILDEHGENIPDQISVEQYYFNRKRDITHGPLCVICRLNFTQWNPKTSKYHRFCSDNCRKKAGELFHKNYKKKFGKDYTIDDPEQQQKLQNGRRISGVYKFLKGGELEYGSSYEAHFLDYCDRILGFTVNDIERCPFTFNYVFQGPDEEEPRIRFYMPDYYMPSFNLIIEIKDGGNNPNMHPKIQSVDKAKEKLKDKAIIESKSYNYIKIVNKEYEPFNRIIEELKSKNFNENGDERKIIYIPETEYGMKTKAILNAVQNDEF